MSDDTVEEQRGEKNNVVVSASKVQVSGCNRFAEGGRCRACLSEFMSWQGSGRRSRRVSQLHRNQGYVLDFEQHREARSRMCHRIQGRDRQRRRGSHDIFGPAACFSRQLYSGGDVQLWCGRKLDHGVLTEVARVSRVAVASECQWHG